MTTNRRDFLKSAAAGVSAAGITSVLGTAAASAKRKPNIVILFIDDLGYGDLECFGNERTPTPNINLMAEHGAKCTMSYITNPPCSPSRCCLMTGMYAQRFGKSGMARGLPIPEDHPTMAEFMRDAGYVTGQIGKWDIGSSTQGPHQRGFMEVARYAPGTPYSCEKEDGSTVYRTDQDGDYMVEFVDRNKDIPFFLYFSPFAIHSPLGETPKSYRERVKGDNGTEYEGAVIAVDDAVGKLLSVLKKHNLEEDTLVLLTGDNGANLDAGGSSAPYRGGKHKANTMYEGWVHTPTIAYWPGTIPDGTVYDGLMATLDFYATAAAVADKPLPQRCEGVNLLPYLTGEKTGDAHEYLFWHNADPTDQKHRNLYAVRWKNWRLVKYSEGWRLFDIESDPEEKNNVAQESPDIVEAMRKQYDAFVETLPPVKPSKDYKPAKNTVQGWGWILDTDN